MSTERQDEDVATPDIDFDEVIDGSGRILQVHWYVRHPRSAMLLRHGRAGSRRRAERKAQEAADRWTQHYGHLLTP